MLMWPSVIGRVRVPDTRFKTDTRVLLPCPCNTAVTRGWKAEANNVDTMGCRVEHGTWYVVACHGVGALEEWAGGYVTCL